MQHDLSGPFKWHANFSNDGCYICNQWRYCLLFFSRKQVIDGSFFSPVEAPNARVALDKICAFSKQTQTADHADQPWLMGSFTSISKSQFLPVADYTRLLTWRLKKSRYLRAAKKVKSAISKRMQ